LLSYQIEAVVAFVGGRTIEEDARYRPWEQFVCSGGRDVGIAEATKDAKIMVGGWFVVEELERSGVGCFCGRNPVDRQCGGG
jgi:hypothetical protein